MTGVSALKRQSRESGGVSKDDGSDSNSQGSHSLSDEGDDSESPWDERPNSTQRAHVPANVVSPDERLKPIKKVVGDHPNSAAAAMKLNPYHTTANGTTTNELNDRGDLPALSLARNDPTRTNSNTNTTTGRIVNGQLVGTGQRTTLKPLSPPSTAGLTTSESMVKHQRNFWSQLEADPSSMEEHQPPEQRHYEEDDDDADNDSPEDETVENSLNNNATTTKSSSNRRRMAGGDHHSVSTSDSRENIEDEEAVEATLCDYTLNRIGDICGTQICSKTTPNAPPITKPASSTRLLSIDRDRLNAKSEVVEEHTAIEVEYVENENKEETTPSQTPNEGGSKKWSPTRKNAYLAAMARKAKEDFAKSHNDADGNNANKESKSRRGLGMAIGLKGKSSQKHRQETETAATDDVYHGFNAAEKRKFLRLISSGLSPTESSERIREERAEKEGRKLKSAKKGSRFSFWKKGSSSTRSNSAPARGAEENEVEEVTPDFDLPRVNEEEKKEEDHASQDATSSSPSKNATASKQETSPQEREPQLQYSSSISTIPEKESITLPPITPRVPPKSQQEQMTPQEDNRQRQMTRQDYTPPSNAKNHEETTPKMSSRSSQESSQQRNPEPPSIDVGSKVTPSSSSSSHEENNATLGDGFAKSGINYYDAVRREQEEEEDDSEADDESEIKSSLPGRAKGSRPPRLAALRPTPKGFQRMSSSSERERKQRSPSDPSWTPNTIRGVRRPTGMYSDVPNNGSETQSDFEKESPSNDNRYSHSFESTGNEEIDKLYSTSSKELPSDEGKTPVSNSKNQKALDELVKNTVVKEARKQGDFNSARSPSPMNIEEAEALKRIETELLRPISTEKSSNATNQHRNPMTERRSPTSTRGQSPQSTRGQSPQSTRGQSPQLTRGQSPQLTQGQSLQLTQGQSPQSTQGKTPEETQGQSSPTNEGQQPVNVVSPEASREKTNPATPEATVSPKALYDTSKNISVVTPPVAIVNNVVNTLNSNNVVTPQSTNKSSPTTPASVNANNLQTPQSADANNVNASRGADPHESDTPASADSTGQAEQKKKEIEIDVGIDTYLNSMEMYSTSSYAGQQDQMSVMSGKSAWTSGSGTVMTNSTGFTQSSRMRRPGAAKSRLAKQKQVQNTSTSNKGWKNSIEAVAASSNRVWDPQNGWKDYDESAIDKPEPTFTEPSGEKIHIPLDKVKRSISKPKGENNQDVKHDPVPVPFPANWEKERDAMIGTFQYSTGDPQNTNQPVINVHMNREDVSVAYTAETDTVDFDDHMSYATGRSTQKSVSPARSKRSTDSVNSSKAPKGWVETMRAASANLAKDGHHWDPKRGWITSDGKPVVLKTVRNAEIVDLTAHALDDPSGEEKKESPITETSPIILEEIYKLSDDADSPVYPEKMDVHLNSTSRQSKSSSTSSEKNEGGASVDQNNTSNANDNDFDIQVETVDEEFDRQMPNVQVVKEKVDEEDMSWFPKTRSFDKKEKGSRDVSPQSGLDTNKTKTTESSSRSQIREPVDIDDADDMETEDDTFGASEKAGLLWEGVAFETDSFMRGNIPAKTHDTDAHTVDMSVSTSSYASSKVVPRLKKNKRDTSPINGWRHTSSTASQSNSANHPVEASKLSSPRDGAGSQENKVHGKELQDAFDPDETNVPWPSEADEMELQQKQSYDTADSQSSVMRRAREWEKNRADKDEPVSHSGNPAQNAERNEGATAEWKSFLGKKVIAESAAALKQKERQSSADQQSGEKLQIDSAGRHQSIQGGSHQQTADKTNSSATGQHISVAQVGHHRPKDSSAEKAKNSSVFREQTDNGQTNGAQYDFDNVNTHPPRRNDGKAVINQAGGTFSQNQSAGTCNTPALYADDTFSDGGADNKSFFKRITSGCAAPILKSQKSPENGTAVPYAHLAFLRTNPQSGVSEGQQARFIPPYLCGRPDIIVEEKEDEAEADTQTETQESLTSQAAKQMTPTMPTHQMSEKTLSKLTGKSMGSDVKVSTSSVISEDFGAKTAYLEAIAMKTAVSNPRKSDSRRRERSSVSSASYSTTSNSTNEHSERWKQFLDRKSSAGVSPSKGRASSTSEVSKAAEKYAAEKVEEMMAMMASRSKSTPKSWKSSDGDGQSGKSPSNSRGSRPPHYATSKRPGGQIPRPDTNPRKNVTYKAAEDLAAARVEAMMAAMTNSTLDEGEI